MFKFKTKNKQLKLKTMAIKAISLDLQEIIYLSLKNKAIEIGKKINNLFISVFNTDINDENDFKGRRPIGLFLIDDDVKIACNKIRLLEIAFKNNKGNLKEEIINIPNREILNHARLIHRQAQRGVIEEDIRNGLRKWQLSYREKIYKEIEKEKKKLKELSSILKD